MFRLFVLSAVSVLVLSFYATPVHAAEAQPGDACTTNGAVQNTGGPEQMPRRTLICNGTTWQNALEQTTAGASLFQIGNDTGSCTTAKLGRIRYNGTSTWEYCNGTTWAGLSAGATPALSSLTAATATNAINNGANTQTWSWNSITTDDGLSLVSSSATSGELFRVDVSNAAATSGAIYASTAGTDGKALVGMANATTGTNYGVYAASASPTGYGVYGLATSTTGANFGVYGHSDSTGGVGIRGYASATSGSTAGVLGSTPSTSGLGVYGYAGATTGSAYGVQGETESSTGRGVYGLAKNATGANYGVYGTTASSGGTGVRGSATAATGSNIGGYFSSASTTGYGVFAETSASTGANYAGYFANASTTGYGLYGLAYGTTGANYGVYGRSASSTGYGGYFANTHASGGWGVYSEDDIGLAANMYLNWGTTRGSGGYGIRDNAGTIECKNSGGAWAACAGGGALSGLTAATATNTINNAANTQTWQWNSLTTGNGMVMTSSSVTSGQVLNVSATNTAGTGEAIYASNSSTANNSSAIYGYATGATGSHNAVAGVNNSSTGRGVVGNATATSGATTGVYGVVSSTTGKAIHGNAAATTGASYAGYFENDSTGGTGIFAYATATTGVTAGGSFATASPLSRAVTANAAATTGENYGVYGRSGSSSGFGIYCEAAANANGCGGNRAWYNASDERLKKDIVPLSDDEGLDAIMQLNPVHYKWRDRAAEDQTEMGFIAQEVEQVLPELVGIGPDTEITSEDGAKETIEDAKSMSYATVVVPLVKAVQQLKAENDALRARLEKLEAQQPATP
ncbi:tail fiber domain-containing protein [Micavibrio aeruginosavorus]|nr:tail fiber domain-containing protein [Micavibrio aeruginosavorus]